MGAIKEATFAAVVRTCTVPKSWRWRFLNTRPKKRNMPPTVIMRDMLYFVSRHCISAERRTKMYT